MSVGRIVATVCIFLVACVGWGILGVSTDLRSRDYSSMLEREVESLWGTPIEQIPPTFTIDAGEKNGGVPLMPEKNDIRVKISMDYRQKGLIWYPTYICEFDGTYAIGNNDASPKKVRIHFDFPANGATYDKFSALVGGKPFLTSVNTQRGIDTEVELAPGEKSDFHITYSTRGIREWRYGVGKRTNRILGLSLTAETDFANVDYPENALSPTEAEQTASGTKMTWAAKDIITAQDIGITVPERLNPGPVATRITFFAPVCLIFFFVMIATMTIVCKIDVHPMHYLFVSAGFFAFHLLLAYLVDQIDIHLAFAIASAVSICLVTSYLSAATKGGIPWKIAAAGQVFYLILFSYTFFLKGFTGLTIAVGSVVTLAILMRVTVHIDWTRVFSRQKIAGGKSVGTSDA